MLLIITDNASNNNTLLNTLNQELKKSVDEIFSTDIIRILCLAHVIQLCVKVLIKVLKINSKNESKEAEPANNKSINDIDKARGIRKVLAKICYD
jgi:large-conductance mechanosensitive channel